MAGKGAPRFARLVFGLLAGNAVGALLCFLVAAAFSTGDLASTIVVNVPTLAILPVLVGLVSAWFWKPLRLGLGATLLWATVCSFLGMGIAWVLMGEGQICLIIVAPIHLVGVVAGAVAGRNWFGYTRERLNAFSAPLLLGLVAAIEPAFRTPHLGVVTDEVHISAPPAKVWPHVLAFSEIPAAPSHWLFRLGLPYPVETTNSGNAVGADRACVFSGDAIFKERIAEFESERLLTFEILEMPRDPELLGHLDATRGQFELRANGDGTTTLVGRTWYKLHVRPAWYFDRWTEHVFRAVHLRVMKNVKMLAEGTL